jgi:hypothetical protein
MNFPLGKGEEYKNMFVRKELSPLPPPILQNMNATRSLPYPLYFTHFIPPLMIMMRRPDINVPLLYTA